MKQNRKQKKKKQKQRNCKRKGSRSIDWSLYVEWVVVAPGQNIQQK